MPPRKSFGFAYRVEQWERPKPAIHRVIKDHVPFVPSADEIMPVRERERERSCWLTRTVQPSIYTVFKRKAFDKLRGGR